MTQYLPPNLLALFAARDPIPFLPPPDKLPHEKKSQPYKGVSDFLQFFEDPKDTPPPTRVETKDERKERKRKERTEQVAYKLEQDLAMWDPASDPSISRDPFKTLFVARINFDTSENKLRREFESYGAIRSIRVIKDHDSKPRGYAFVEFEHERDMHSAYKHADGKKVEGRRVLVDIERGRTVKGWKPRRLGGGLGGTRRGGPEVNVKYSGREDSNWENKRDESRSPQRERGGDRGGDRGERKRDHREPEVRRRRSKSKERRRRSRSKERRRRSRSPRKEDDGERKRRRSRSREKRRSRSRDRDRKRSRRSRSRERRRSRDRDHRAPHAGGGDVEGPDMDGLIHPDDIKQENGNMAEYEEASAARDEAGNGDDYPEDEKVRIEDIPRFSDRTAEKLASDPGNEYTSAARSAEE